MTLLLLKEWPYNFYLIHVLCPPASPVTCPIMNYFVYIINNLLPWRTEFLRRLIRAFPHFRIPWVMSAVIELGLIKFEFEFLRTEEVLLHTGEFTGRSDEEVLGRKSVMERATFGNNVFEAEIWLIDWLIHRSLVGVERHRPNSRAIIFDGLSMFNERRM